MEGSKSEEIEQRERVKAREDSGDRSFRNTVIGEENRSWSTTP